MVRKGDTVSMRIDPTNKAVLDWIIFNHRATTGQGMTLDEALWYAYTHDVTEAVEAVLKTGAQPPIDERRESLKNRAEQRRKDNSQQ